jgi:hypothetical protein
MEYRVFMDRIGVGIDEGDGDGSNARGSDFFGDGPDVSGGGGFFDETGRRDTLIESETEPAVDNGVPSFAFEAVEVAPGLPADQKNILKSFCRDEGDLGPFPFK